MNAATASIFQRAIEEASKLDTHSTGALLVEVSRRIPRNTEIKIISNRIRVQHTEHIDNLFAADSIDDALASNADLFP